MYLKLYVSRYYQLSKYSSRSVLYTQVEVILIVSKATAEKSDVNPHNILLNDFKDGAGTVAKLAALGNGMCLLRFLHT